MWKRKMIPYDICIPPIRKPFPLLNSEEVKEYFQWYIGKIPERIHYLSYMIAQDFGLNESQINLLPDSLIIVWKWFLGVANTEISDASGMQLDLQTEYIIRDIGMFLGELFHSQYKSISWSYFESPKTDLFVNKPILIGFQDNSVSPPYHAVFEPIHMVRTQACKVLSDRQSEYDLINLYRKWTSKIMEQHHPISREPCFTDICN